MWKWMFLILISVASTQQPTFRLIPFVEHFQFKSNQIEIRRTYHNVNGTTHLPILADAILIQLGMIHNRETTNFHIQFPHELTTCGEVNVMNFQIILFICIIICAAINNSGWRIYIILYMPTNNSVVYLSLGVCDFPVICTDKKTHQFKNFEFENI